MRTLAILPGFITLVVILAILMGRLAAVMPV